MTVKELRELLAHHRDEAIIVMPRGLPHGRHKYTNTIGVQTGRYQAETRCQGEFASDEDFTEDAADGVPAVILWANG